MTKQIFPVRYWATHRFGWADCPILAKMIWNRIRKDVAPDLIWYATDIEIISPVCIHLYVYDIEDNFHGGIGSCIFETKIHEFTNEEQVVLDKMVEGIYTNVAEEELQRREDKKRMAKIMAIRLELFGK